MSPKHIKEWFSGPGKGRSLKKNTKRIMCKPLEKLLDEHSFHRCHARVVALCMFAYMCRLARLYLGMRLYTGMHVHVWVHLLLRPSMCLSLSIAMFVCPCPYPSSWGYGHDIIVSAVWCLPLTCSLG